MRPKIAPMSAWKWEAAIRDRADRRYQRRSNRRPLPVSRRLRTLISTQAMMNTGAKTKNVSIPSLSPVLETKRPIEKPKIAAATTVSRSSRRFTSITRNTPTTPRLSCQTWQPEPTSAMGSFPASQLSRTAPIQPTPQNPSAPRPATRATRSAPARYQTHHARAAGGSRRPCRAAPASAIRQAAGARLPRC